MLPQGGGRETLEGGSNGHNSYETDFSVRYLAGAAVVVELHVAAVHLLFVLVLDLAVLALGEPLALALESGLDRLTGPSGS